MMWARTTEAPSNREAASQTDNFQLYKAKLVAAQKLADFSREEQAAIALDQLASWLTLSAPNEQTASTQEQQIQQQAKQQKQRADKQVQ